jgi:hypothetical protein
MTDEARFIVITTIFEPTAAVKAFARRDESRVVVVGDQKTPADWRSPNVDYLSPSTQLELGFSLCERLPWNHYARKMVGYLWAARQGASVIVDTDDDNIPRDDWAFPAFDGRFSEANGVAYYNAYRRYTDAFVWPRGFPLRLVRDLNEPAFETRSEVVGVWQALADDDPDVDAIYRLVSSEPVSFRDEDPLVLGSGTVCPFNSQNTAFRAEAFALMYLPALVTFRFTDILRSLVAQPILWAAGMRLGFTGPTVRQERNAHDLMQDFASEIPMYLSAERVVEIASASVASQFSIEQNLRTVYAALAEDGIVEPAELALLDSWLDDLVAIESA